MTPARSGSNYSIQSNESGQGNSSHNPKRQECHPRGDAQMEDSNSSTSSNRLASSFDTLIESPEAEITTISVVRPESISTSGNFPKSLDRHHELISSSEIFHGARKYRGTSEGLDTHVLQRTSPKYKILVEKPENYIRGPAEEIGLRKEKQPSGSSQASTSKSHPEQVPNKPKQKGKPKEKGKAKPKWNKPHPQNYRIPNKEKTAMDNVFNMARTLMEFKNKEEKILNQSFPRN
ncbi:hypothetical protein O181_071689 [Austropuccinia psidii MF-1]|uniref:Uncharacterized protein n=1 Tax=Austropuccinia psidii MF-1 TaxID=1389203 RepID=A0A9Q3F392_9BASI|nr:hypothetical protein [Austropuccinia psidii MF-1]